MTTQFARLETIENEQILAEICTHDDVTFIRIRRGGEPMVEMFMEPVDTEVEPPPPQEILNDLDLTLLAAQLDAAVNQKH